MNEETISVSSFEVVRSVASYEAGIYPHDADTIFHFEQELVKNDTNIPSKADLFSSENKTQSGFDECRVFLNYVDMFNNKHISSFLSEQVVGSLMVKEEEYHEELEEVEEEEEFDFKKKEEIPKPKYVIIGSLKNNLKNKTDQINDQIYQNGMTNQVKNTEFQWVSEIVDTSNRTDLFKVLKTCRYIIYDISRYPEQIDEARWVLHHIKDDLVKMHKETPRAFSKMKDVPTFILISTFMTWAHTKPINRSNPRASFREKNFRKRKCHPHYKDHAMLERELDTVGKTFPDKFKTIVLCSGLQYGYEEDTLNFLFKLAWENSPALPLYTNGKNCIPLIHIRDLATMIFNIIEDFPQSRKLKYLLAVEKEVANLKKITKAISKGFTTGEITNVPPDEMNVPEHTFDCLTANVRMEPNYFTELETMKWTSESFLGNISNIVQEYRESRNLIAISILVIGPPATGKTTISKKISDYYKLHYLSPKLVTDHVIQKLNDKIDKIKEKEMKAKMLEMEEGEEEDGEGEYDEEEEEEEEERVEEEEEGEENIDELTEELKELMESITKNDGQLDEEHLLKGLREFLHSPPIRNQGYVLDDFPNTIMGLKNVFIGGVKRSNKEDNFPGGSDEDVEEEEFSIEEEEQKEDSPPDAVPYPEFIIGLEASNKSILERVMGLSEDTIKELHYEEEEINKRLTDYRTNNTEDSGVLDFVDDREIHPHVFNTEKDESENLNDTFEAVKQLIGEARNFGMSPEELDEMERLSKELLLAQERAEIERKNAVRKQAEEERLKKHALWEETKEVLSKAEEENFKGDRMAFRKYLKTYIYPTLIPGLLQVSRERPMDPTDYVAEYLLKENPEGMLFDPEKPRATRKAFQEMHKTRNVMFSINALDKKYQEEMYKPEV